MKDCHCTTKCIVAGLDEMFHLALRVPLMLCLRFNVAEIFLEFRLLGFLSLAKSQLTCHSNLALKSMFTPIPYKVA